MFFINVAALDDEVLFYITHVNTRETTFSLAFTSLLVFRSIGGERYSRLIYEIHLGDLLFLSGTSPRRASLSTDRQRFRRRAGQVLPRTCDKLGERAESA